VLRSERTVAFCHHPRSRPSCTRTGSSTQTLRAQGFKYREIGEQMGISIPSVSRILKA
jgi:DNA-binding CsgD family transcriptional regulator